MKNINETPVPFVRILNHIAHEMPVELVSEMSKWSAIMKSPYGHSYYDSPVGWDFKTPNGLRISNHWNFYSQTKKHCETTHPVPNNTHWTLGRFNSNLMKYEPLMVLPKLNSSVKDTLIFKLIHNTTVKAKAIQCINEHTPIENRLQAIIQLELVHAEKLIKIMQ